LGRRTAARGNGGAADRRLDLTMTDEMMTPRGLVPPSSSRKSDVRATGAEDRCLADGLAPRLIVRRTVDAEALPLRSKAEAMSAPATSAR